jgi:hypothetical protein
MAAKKKIICIPTLGDSPADFAKLCQISSEVSKSGAVSFNFSQCEALHPNAIAFIGGIARLIESRNCIASFEWETLQNPDLESLLSGNGFTKAFKHSYKEIGEHSILYREDKQLSMDSIMDYLADGWLGRGWVVVSNRLKNAIVGKIWEIYNNAFEHSKTPIGVFSCGQHFEAANELILSVVDFGCGIPTLVKNFLSEARRAERLKDPSCLRWAFQRGNSTSSGGVAKGLGLDLLKEFIGLNQGKLEIYSNKAYGLIDGENERYEKLDSPFEGTMVHITLRCDENLYQFKDEIDPVFGGENE